MGWGGSGKLLAVTAEREPGEGYCLGVCPGVLRAPLLPNPPLSPTRVTEPWIAFCPLPYSQPMAEGGWVPPCAGLAPVHSRQACAACSQPPLPVGVPSLACLLGLGHALTYPALPAGAPPSRVPSHLQLLLSRRGPCPLFLLPGVSAP